jgi:hypothetical protein
MEVLALKDLPGMSRTKLLDSDIWKPCKSLEDIPPQFNRRVLLLATASITDDNIFCNGLYQNVFVIYKMAEILGWLPIYIVNSKPTDLAKVPEILRQSRIATVEDILKTPIPVGLYLEIGMSIDKMLRRHMKMLGARVAKLYLGNILNIDIETPVFYNPMHFAHHVVGETQEIWVSPHYAQHAEYAAELNNVKAGSADMKVAPYIWDSSIMTDDGRRHISWRPRLNGEKPTFIIMEPNISFQKNSLVPILAVEAFARTHPDVEFDCIIFNSDRLQRSPFFNESIRPYLETMTKKGKANIQWAGRKDIISILTTYPHLMAVCHQVNNEYNYMILEFLNAGFPVIHNGDTWKDFGYAYEGNDFVKASELMWKATASHHEKLEPYKAHGKILAWRHSVYNPQMQESWRAMLEGSKN